MAGPRKRQEEDEPYQLTMPGGVETGLLFLFFERIALSTFGDPIMVAASERIVVQATRREKKAITAKAKKLGLPNSELMRRGATAYQSAEADEELGALANAAKAAADRAADSIDDTLAFIDASNRRIAAMEAKAAANSRTGN